MKAILNFLVSKAQAAGHVGNVDTRSLDALQSLAISRSDCALRKIEDAAKQLRNGYAEQKLTLSMFKDRILDGSEDQDKS